MLRQICRLTGLKPMCTPVYKMSCECTCSTLRVRSFFSKEIIFCNIVIMALQAGSRNECHISLAFSCAKMLGFNTYRSHAIPLPPSRPDFRPVAPTSAACDTCDTRAGD